MGNRSDDLAALPARIDKLVIDNAALTAEAARLQALVCAVPDLIIRLHRDGTYLD